MGGGGKVVNVNVGVLGHVDSGKTSLVRALSTMLSTAALDKHPQSKERGITLDLGFSAFTVEAPEQLADTGVKQVQYTLVDCPGHASLIRTIIGGAQIIDRMILVVDVTKGIQTQTAECLVIGEILTDDLIVVLNKIDLLPEATRTASVERVTKAIEQALSSTRFKGSPIACISAIVGGDGKAGVGEGSAAAPPQPPATTVKQQGQTGSSGIETQGLEDLVQLIRRTTVMPERGDASKEPLYFAIDHCFPIKGQGTVVTGTMLGGTVNVGDMVEIPQLGLERKVKSMQMFRKPVEHAAKGDRVALCFANLNADALERGTITTPGSVPSTSAAIVLLRKVRFFPLACKSGSKLHVTVGHATTVAKVTFFGSAELKEVAAQHLGKNLPMLAFDHEQEFLYDEELRGGGKAKGGPFLQWALLNFDQPVICQAGATVIGSRLDMSVETKSCRIAFYGRVASQYTKTPTEEELARLRVYRFKERHGAVDRIVDKKPDEVGRVRDVVARSMFSKDTDMSKFINLTVETDAGATGRIQSAFGKTGKFNVHFGGDGAVVKKGDRLTLRHKRMIFATAEDRKRLLQD
ncbi:Selenocysteine-specific elongation factor [Hondaea fermentalgiana]|uniref:Elongation factor Tu, chloroplastic n=1 Tax=Hondaea fermentalgiana TaxID=2315210 RepID=A0A2R5G8P6_9STRA|nr:Selenocysteine-specific elongation factor [Hondaea fermentalgiana]|eukprot:GBG26915.1 Selenocysteine-specific elongation factor [Hondaea fermentalgiana]